MKEAKFEDNIKELEQIVNDLESGSFDIDESITKYTRAMQLVKECDVKLKNIESQVSKIVSENGSLEDFSVDKEN